MINKEKIINALKRREYLSITDLVRITKLKRCQVRTAITFLLGSNRIKERQIGTAKIYTLK